VTAAGSFVLPVRVYWEDTDGSGVVYYANYLRFLERARTEWLRALGYEQARLARDFGVAFAVRTLNVDYRHPARLDDHLQVLARVVALRGATIDFSQAVVRSQTVLVAANVRIACVNIATFQPARIPRELRTALAAGAPGNADAGAP